MSDLRALLGDDRYDEVIEKAANAICGGRYGGRVTRFSRAQLNALDVRDAHDCLAAVLPDLLAEANTRADDAEAKARRFANLLGNNAKALNNVLPREVLRQKAEAWDEGYWLGKSDAAVNAVRVDGQHVQSINPYRTRED